MKEVQFEPAKQQPICPFCDQTLENIEYTRHQLSFGFMKGYTWVVLLQCPQCAKVLGSQTWD